MVPGAAQRCAASHRIGAGGTGGIAVDQQRAAADGGDAAVAVRAGERQRFRAHLGQTQRRCGAIRHHPAEPGRGVVGAHGEDRGGAAAPVLDSASATPVRLRPTGCSR